MLLWLFMLLIPSPALAFPGDPQSCGDFKGEVEYQLQGLDLSQLESHWQRLQQDLAPYLPSSSFGEGLKELLQGKMPLNPREILEGLLRCLAGELKASLHLLSQLLLLALASALLKSLQGAFGEENLSPLAGKVVFLALITLVLTSFGMYLRSGSETIDKMLSFWQAFLPFLITLLAASRGIHLSAFLYPVLILGLTFMVNLI